MGKLKDGIFGPVTGKIKGLVFYQLNGQDVVRTVGSKKSTAKSEAVIEKNSRFGLLSTFLSKVKPFIKAGFKKEAIGTIYSYHNIATSYNMLNAVSTVDGEPTINFEHVLLSRGACLPALDPMVSLEAEGLKFTWSCAHVQWPRSHDRVMMLAYFPELSEAIFDIDGAKRLEEQGVLNLPAGLISQRMEVYIAFITDDRENVSDSIYLGRMN